MKFLDIFLRTLLIIESLALSTIIFHALDRDYLTAFLSLLMAFLLTLVAFLCHETEDEFDYDFEDESTTKLVERLRNAKAKSEATATQSFSVADRFNHCAKQFKNKGMTTIFEASTDSLYDCLIHVLDGELFIDGKKTGIFENEITGVKYHIDEKNDLGYIRLQLNGVEEISFRSFDFDGILYTDEHRLKWFCGESEFFDLLKHRIRWNEKTNEKER